VEKSGLHLSLTLATRFVVWEKRGRRVKLRKGIDIRGNAESNSQKRVILFLHVCPTCITARKGKEELAPTLGPNREGGGSNNHRRARGDKDQKKLLEFCQDGSRAQAVILHSLRQQVRAIQVIHRASLKLMSLIGLVQKDTTRSRSWGKGLDPGAYIGGRRGEALIVGGVKGVSGSFSTPGSELGGW